MAKWYEVEKAEKGIKEFLECNWKFHDLRAVKIEYVPGMDMAEIFLQYDTGCEGVLLRFAWIKDMHINTQHNFDGDWIFGSTLMLQKNGALIWLDEEFPENKLEEMKKFATWVEA